MIRNEIRKFFTATILAAILIMAIFLYFHLEKTMQATAKNAALSECRFVSQNCVSFIDNLTHYLNFTLINKDFQDRLAATNQSSLARQRLYSSALIEVLLQDMNIISAVIFDDAQNAYIERATADTFRLDPQIAQSPAYKSAIAAAKGDFVTFNNGGGAISIDNDDDNFISFAKDFTRLIDYESMGTIALNIKVNKLKSLLISDDGESDMDTYIVSADGSIIVADNDTPVLSDDLLSFLQGKDTFFSSRGITNSAVMAKAQAGFSDWVVIAHYRTGLFNGSPVFIIYFAAIAAVLLTLLNLLNGFYIHRRITLPIETLEKHMNQAINKDSESYSLLQIPNANRAYSSELVSLYNIYNKMIMSINELIEKLKANETKKREAELSLLLAQVRPHFLYNALDALSALALIGDSKKSYQLSQALGAFYKKSLSSGAFMVALNQEIACVKDYLIVLNVRYKDKINAAFDIAADTTNKLVPKLILQPLIENAVYHGIKLKPGMGNIYVKAGMLIKPDLREYLVISVFDDGVGMTKEKIDLVLSGGHHSQMAFDDIDRGGSGFGVYSLLEKLRLQYGVEDILEIESVAGEYTLVTLRIPM